MPAEAERRRQHSPASESTAEEPMGVEEKPVNSFEPNEPQSEKSRLLAEIERGGGKLAIEKILLEEGFPVPKSHFLYYDDLKNARLIEASLRDLRPPYIVRGSHQNDWHGYIDVLPTFGDLSTIDEVREAIRKIKQTAASGQVRIHAEDWGQDFTPEVHVLLQEQSTSQFVGSMLRHPHRLGQIDINYVDIEKRRGQYDIFGNLQRENFSRARRYEHGPLSTHTIGTKASDGELKEAIRLYESVEASDLFDPGWVYQMEIGLNPFLIYQLRPFKPKEEAAGFAISYTRDADFPSIASDLAFGITPPEGVELDFISASESSLRTGLLEEQAKSGKPYGLILVDRSENSLPPEIRLGNLVVAVTASYENDYLCHGEYRLLKRTQYGIVSGGGIAFSNVENTGIWFYKPEDLALFRRSRLWSNGRRSLIVPVDYAERIEVTSTDEE